MDRRTCLYLLKPILGEGADSGLDELSFDCPFCLKRKGTSDTGKHLYVNPSRVLHDSTGWYYCHRCKATGPISRLLKNSKSVKSATKWEEFLLSLRSQTKVETKPLVTVSLPEDYTPILKGTEAYKYLISRSINDEIISEYKIGFGSKNLRNLNKIERSRYAGSGRIIFPDFDSLGNVVYWVARTYKGHKVKYKNPFVDSRDKLFNLVRASEYEDVIITEGVISAIVAGRNAVATYGKEVTTTQVSMLSDLKFDKYYVALDGDTLKKDPWSKLPPSSVRLCELLLRRGCDVRIVELPFNDDPASVKDFGSYIKSASKYDFATSLRLIMNSKR